MNYGEQQIKRKIQGLASSKIKVLNRIRLFGIVFSAVTIIILFLRIYGNTVKGDNDEDCDM